MVVEVCRGVLISNALNFLFANVANLAKGFWFVIFNIRIQFRQRHVYYRPD